jgi:RimJ/RimL family protein N-acetyltransferase
VSAPSIIETPRLRLVPLERRHFEAEAAFFARPESRPFGGPKPREGVWRVMAAMIGHWALEGFGFRALERRSDGAYCGRAGLWAPEGWPETELGWTFTDLGQADGLGAEALIALRQEAYETFGLPPLATLIAPNNFRARQMAERVGAAWERTLDLDGLGLVELYRHPGPEGSASGRALQGASA